MSVPFYASHVDEGKYLSWKNEAFGLCIPPASPWNTVDNIVMQIAEIASKKISNDEREFYFYPCVDSHFSGGFLSKDGLPKDHPELIVAACNKIFEDPRFSNRCALLGLHVISQIKNMEMSGQPLLHLADRVQNVTRDDFIFGDGEAFESLKALAFTSVARLLRKANPYTSLEKERHVELSVEAMKIMPSSFGRGAADLFNSAVQEGYDPTPHHAVIKCMFAENRKSVLGDVHWKKYVCNTAKLPHTASDDDIYISFVQKRFSALAPLLI